jgi:hypothetical protein
MMEIIEELRECILKENSYFLNDMANRRYNAGEKPQSAFLNILAEELGRKLPKYKMIISVRFKRIITPSIKKPEELLGISRKSIRKNICEQGYCDLNCESEKCFEGGHFKGAEVDALLIRNGDICLIEYQHGRKRICYDFMKMYWMRQFLNKQFESLFVTSLTTKLDEGSTTFQRFNNYIDTIKPVLDTLLQNWTVLELVNLSGSEKRRRFNWKP